MFGLGSVSCAGGSRQTLSTSHRRVSEPLPPLLSPEPQLEYTARLDFLWRVQAKEEINEMKELREHNENMLRNILPSHVARHFLEKDRDNEVSPGSSAPDDGRPREGCGRTPWSQALRRPHCPLPIVEARHAPQHSETHVWPPQLLVPHL